MANLALVKGLFTKYESFYKAYQGQDMKHIVTQNNHLESVIRDLQGKIKGNEKEFTNLKVVVANLD